MKRALGVFICGMLAVFLLAGAASGGARCEAQDAGPLKTAALQQYLMVAALVCSKVEAYNGFVLSHRDELMTSDGALLRYFRRHGGEASYHAFKTLLANTASLLSVHDPSFCTTAGATFTAMSEGAKTLAAMVAERPLPAEAGCTP